MAPSQWQCLIAGFLHPKTRNAKGPPQIGSSLRAAFPLPSWGEQLSKAFENLCFQLSLVLGRPRPSLAPVAPGLMVLSFESLLPAALALPLENHPFCPLCHACSARSLPCIFHFQADYKYLLFPSLLCPHPVDIAK